MTIPIIKYLICIVTLLCGVTKLAEGYVPSAESRFYITDYGAHTEKTDNTKAIQDAIDACSAVGGGYVVIPNGIFLSGGITLKNHVALYLEPSAVLTGIPDLDAYPNAAFIHADGQQQVAILGRGTINGQGEHSAFQGKDVYDGIKGRPNTIHLINCTDILLKEFTLRNGTRWCIMLQESQHIHVDGISVISRVVANNDGLDIVDCKDVRVANSYFDCGDDAICPKSHSKTGVKNLVITNCIIKSESNAIKFGTNSYGGFQDVTISNCVIYDTRLSGIALELVDGGEMNRIAINNITMNKVNGGIFIKLGKRGGDKPGILKNVSISNVMADSVGLWQPDTAASYYKVPHHPLIGMSIVGQPGYEVENVTLSNIYMRFVGGGTTDDAKREMPYRPNAYPEYNNYGVTPAYGFNCRHVKGLTFKDVQLDYITADRRPPLFFDNVSDLKLQHLKLTAHEHASAFVRLRDVNDVSIIGCKPKKQTIPFLSKEGKTSTIILLDNE